MLYQVKEPVIGVIVKRPSLHCKTPYVADVQIEDKEIMGHSPSLGCCGLADKGAVFLFNDNDTNKR